MTIKEWFSGNGSYADGLILLQKHCNNPALIRFFEKESALNRMKLRIQLKQFLNAPTIAVPSKPTVKKPRPGMEKPLEKSPDEVFLRKKPISAYPKELHKVYQQRIESFLQLSSLKYELNQVAEDDSEKALELQCEIWKLFEVNEKCWKLLNHYDETGQILPTESQSDFSDCSAQELVNQRQRLYANVSKRKKTIQNIELQIANEEKPGVLERLKEKLFSKKKKLQELQNDIDKLSKLIDNG